MKQNLKTIAVILASACTLVTSCTDNYEDLPVNQYTDDFLFSRTDSIGDRALVFLGTIYESLDNGHGRVGGYYLDVASDDALPIAMSSNPDVLRLQLGQYTSRSTVGGDMKWNSYYELFRKVNIFLRGIDRVPFMMTYKRFSDDKPQRYANLLKAEARFIRAWFYFQMIERYGGVTLVGDKVFDIEDNLELPRNSFEECVNYIVSELDAVKDSLYEIPIPNPTVNAHRPTKQAAQALKSRVLLYAASPLFNADPVEKDNLLVGYAYYDRNRWKLAADAARELIEGRGHLGTGDVNLSPDFRETFLSYYQTDNNPEILFFRQVGQGKSVETDNGPLGLSGGNNGSGRTNPTQNLVDAFPMLDGKMPGESDKYPYDSQNPYANRDPRLDYTILHNGSQWLGSALKTWQGGANNPSAGDYSLTSYYSKKFMGRFESSTEYSNCYHLWVMLRYAEVLLNFAEAQNEWLDTPTDEVYDAIKYLRKRAGIEPGNNGMYGLKPGMTQDEMRKVIHNERRIELAFEEHRFFDIRRWREAENIYRKPLRGMKIVVGEGVTYTPYDVLTVSWDNRRYLYPIPYGEVNKNDNMKQNPKW